MIYARERRGAEDLRGPARSPEYSAKDIDCLVDAMFKATKGFTGQEHLDPWKEAYASRVWMAQRIRIRTHPNNTFLNDLVDAGVLHLWKD